MKINIKRNDWCSLIIGLVGLILIIGLATISVRHRTNSPRTEGQLFDREQVIVLETDCSIDSIWIDRNGQVLDVVVTEK